MKAMLLGGYGNVGIFLSELILAHTGLSIIISGRNEEKAKALKEKLSRNYNENRIETLQVDASDLNSLYNSFEEADLIINSASTIEFTEKIVKALLHTRKDYFDVLLSSSQKLIYLKAAEEKFIFNNQCIITDCGFHPGIPAALVNYAAKDFDELHVANIGSLLNMDWKFELSSPNTIKEFVLEFKEYDSSAFVNGKWKKLTYKDYRKFEFGKPFGNKLCVPMMMEEMKELPNKYPSLTETGFYVSGFNWLTDYLVMPLMMFAVNKFPAGKLNFIINLFKWSVAKFSKPPYKVVLQLIAEGNINGKKKNLKIEVGHEDGYYLTAAAAFACIKQYLDGSIKESGLHFQGNIVEPEKYFDELINLNCSVRKNYERSYSGKR